MTIRRVFIEPDICNKGLSEKELILPPKAAHRLVSVLRLKKGTQVEVLDGTGRIIKGKLEIENSVIKLVSVESFYMSDNCELIVAQSLIKGDKLEQVVQRTCELGATAIYLFASARSVVQWNEKADRKLLRLKHIAEDAARQSGRSSVPEIAWVGEYGNLLHKLETFEGVAVVGDIKGESLLSEFLSDKKVIKSIVLVIGPEGGWDESEREMMSERDLQRVRFSPHVLRAETAALVGLSVIQVFLGNA